MKRLIYPSPIYTFLDFMLDEQKENHSLQNKILDCAAGGKQPPLGLFAEYGFDAYGIDISSKQVEKAYGFTRENNLYIRIQTGDMRKIPYEDTAFDFVYEFYSICHLSKSDTTKALSEMKRVLKKGGLLFIGFMSSACWPILGQEISCGEFALIESEKSEIHKCL